MIKSVRLWRSTKLCVVSNLQINVKLGGCNVKLSAPPPLPEHMRSKPIMVMGADVHHPPPNNTKSPSIAGVVGSYDPQFASYNTVISPQVRRTALSHKMDICWVPAFWKCCDGGKRCI